MLEKLKKVAFICGFTLIGFIVGVICSSLYSRAYVRDIREQASKVAVDRDSLRRDQRRATESARSVDRAIKEFSRGIDRVTERAERAESQVGRLREIIIGSGGSIVEGGKLSEEARGILRYVYENGRIKD